MAVIKENEGFHKLSLKVTRKDDISSLANYENDLLDIVESLVKGSPLPYSLG